MNNLDKKLHLLRAVLSEGDCSIKIQKEGIENYLVTLQIGTKRDTMHVTPSQWIQIPNNLDQWDRVEMDDEN